MTFPSSSSSFLAKEIRKIGMFFLFFLVCHYCFYMTQLFPMIDRVLDVAFDVDKTPDSTTTTTASTSFHAEMGLVSCVTDRQSVLDALVLAQSIHDDFNWGIKESTVIHNETVDNRKEDMVLEIYHPGTLSRFLQGHLETTYQFVTVVSIGNDNDSGSSSSSSDDNFCLTKALQTTKLKYVVAVTAPSIQFLHDPKFVVQKIKQQQQKQTICQKKNFLKFVSCLNPAELPEAIEEINGLCLLDHQIASSNHTSSSSSIHVQHKIPTRTLKVASIEGDDGEWMSLHPSYSKVVSLNEFHREIFEYSDGKDHPEIDNLLQKHWHRQFEARRLITMDRPIGWVAFDSGFHADQSSTLNTLSAANSSLVAGTKIINIDIALTSDHQLVALHNDKSITPFADENFHQEGNNNNNNNNNVLPIPISKMTASQALRITNPCLPPEIVHGSLLPGPYQPYKCKPEPIAMASDFIAMVQAHDKNQHHHHHHHHHQIIVESPTEMILDLKAPTVSLQVEQARILARDALPTLQKLQLSVRFFSVFEEDLLAATVLPEEALQALASDPSLEGIAYYVNVPSSVACLQITGWIHNQTSFLNKGIQGCFIILDHEMIAQSWIDFANKHEVNTSHIPANNMSAATAPKMICDVPRKESFLDPSLWDKEYERCLSNGYDYVHDPFPPPPRADTSRHSLMASVSPNHGKLIRKITQQQLRDARESGKRVIHYGYGFPGDWSPEDQFQWYKGLRPIPSTHHSTELDINDSNFRCVTKVLSVMLFLKFQEMGVLDIDDLVVDGNHTSYPMTYRQVFSNTGGVDGTPVGEHFKYSNVLWPPIPSAFERLTGIRFVDAMNHYIIEPMGLQGFFDETNVTMPPYAARGYNGHPEDLVVIGGTLASGGVSPKTRKQIVSASSVATMLANSITSPSLAESFAKDKLVTDMDRVYNRTGAFPYGFANGYGAGVWRVKGWRHTAQGLPIQGWLAQGSCMVYFDATGLIVSFLPKGSFTGGMVRSFAKMVRDWGDTLLEKEEVLAAKNSRNLMAVMKGRKRQPTA